jgi:hypothetical protein
LEEERNKKSQLLQVSEMVWSRKKVKTHCFFGGDEELRTVCIRASVRHANGVWFVVL